MTFSQRKQRADHAGREDEHLLGLEVEQPPRLGRSRERVELAALTGGGVRDAGVDDDRLRLRAREMRLRDDDRSGLHTVDREHRGADRGHGRADDRNVFSGTANARRDARGGEALARRSRSYEHPRQAQSVRLGEAEGEVRVLDGLPGRALAEVVERTDDDPGAGRVVREHPDLGSIGALDT